MIDLRESYCRDYLTIREDFKTHSGSTFDMHSVRSKAYLIIATSLSK